MIRIIFLMAWLIIFSGAAFAADLQTERARLICALGSLAAYEGEHGETAKNFLQRRGWEITALENPSEVKLHRMSKGDVTVFYFTGTEDLKGVSSDFNLEFVPFNDDKNILVHRGFKNYVDAALEGENLKTLLADIKNPSAKIYVTGHSLGGAAATLTAAKLADAGADMSRIEVITFGAPSVGNGAFSAAYRDKINLTRIFMKSDPIAKTLKVFGYEQFGAAVKFKDVEEHRKSFHAMILYLDRALRNYCDAGDFGAEKNSPAYVAQTAVVKEGFKSADKKYLRSILREGNETEFVEIKKPTDFAFDAAGYSASAKKAGCEYVIFKLVRAKPIRDSRPSASRIILEETICNLEGFPLAMNSSSFSTEDWTVLEAILFAQGNLSAAREKVIRLRT